MTADARAVNLANWNARVPHHVRGYGLERYRADPALLSGVVQFDRPRLGEVAGLELVHLQCHLGTDTLSLARLGARVTGLDFSAPALEAARRLAADCGADIAFVEADVYQAVEALGAGRFDLVYTGVGALNWLPDVRRWARVVAGLLRPGGRLFLREQHPMLATLGPPRPDGLVTVAYPYFETPEGTAFHDATTYVAHDGPIASPDTVEWSHGLAETLTALADAGLALVSLEEHDSAPWDFLPGATTCDARGEWRLRERPERLAASFTLRARKG